MAMPILEITRLRETIGVPCVLSLALPWLSWFKLYHRGNRSYVKRGSGFCFISCFGIMSGASLLCTSSSLVGPKVVEVSPARRLMVPIPDFRCCVV